MSGTGVVPGRPGGDEQRLSELVARLQSGAVLPMGDQMFLYGVIEAEVTTFALARLRYGGHWGTLEDAVVDAVSEVFLALRRSYRADQADVVQFARVVARRKLINWSRDRRRRADNLTEEAAARVADPRGGGTGGGLDGEGERRHERWSAVEGQLHCLTERQLDAIVNYLAETRHNKKAKHEGVVKLRKRLG